MHESPELTHATLVGVVEAEYAILIGSLTFLPLGADSASYAYRVQAIDGTVYFLKLRALHGFRPSSLLVPTHLHEQGIPHILTPLSTVSHAPWALLDDFALSLYPFVQARVGADVGLSKHQWAELGATVKRIHSSQLPSDLIPNVPCEAFIPSRRKVIRKLQVEIERNAMSDAVQVDMAEFWKSRRDDVHLLLERADELGSHMREASSSLVLCHADLHTWNIILDPSGDFWLVDWDETTMALKERDLMFVIGGIGRGLVSRFETLSFLQGYGVANIDPQALSYYRYAWAVQDMGAYGEQVFFSAGLGEASRRDALEGFVSMFEPGNIVDIAFLSDDIAR